MLFFWSALQVSLRGWVGLWVVEYAKRYHYILFLTGRMMQRQVTTTYRGTDFHWKPQESSTRSLHVHFWLW